MVGNKSKSSDEASLWAATAAAAKDRIVKALQEDQLLSTTSLRARTGLSRGTVLKYTNELAIQGLICKKRISESSVTIFFLPQEVSAHS